MASYVTGGCKVKDSPISTNILGSTRVKETFGDGAVQPYLTGGLAWQQLEGEVSASVKVDDGDDQASATISDSETQYGFTLGAGGDWAISNDFSLTSGYHYYRFSDDGVVTDLHSFRVGGSLRY